jgi:hypothetical protein
MGPPPLGGHPRLAGASGLVRLQQIGACVGQVTVSVRSADLGGCLFITNSRLLRPRGARKRCQQVKARCTWLQPTSARTACPPMACKFGEALRCLARLPPQRSSPIRGGRRICEHRRRALSQSQRRIVGNRPTLAIGRSRSAEAWSVPRHRPPPDRHSARLRPAWWPNRSSSRIHAAGKGK